MKAILELDVTASQEQLLRDVLVAMNISFKSKLVEELSPYSAKEIGESINGCIGMWKDHAEFSDFNDFRRQAWKKRDSV